MPGAMKSCGRVRFHLVDSVVLSLTVRKVQYVRKATLRRYVSTIVLPQLNTGASTLELGVAKYTARCSLPRSLSYLIRLHIQQVRWSYLLKTQPLTVFVQKVSG